MFWKIEFLTVLFIPNIMGIGLKQKYTDPGQLIFKSLYEGKCASYPYKGMYVHCIKVISLYFIVVNKCTNQLKHTSLICEHFIGQRQVYSDPLSISSN